MSHALPVPPTVAFGYQDHLDLALWGAASAQMQVQRPPAHQQPQMQVQRPPAHQQPQLQQPQQEPAHQQALPHPKDAVAFGVIKVPQWLIDRARIADRSKQPPPPPTYYDPPPQPTPEPPPTYYDPPPQEGWSTGTKVAVGVGVAAAVGSAIYLLAGD